ncbi:MAG: DDE-type integrase/transposase/recombinase [Rhodocyclaceae bacterium]|nr:DDE-type integrase/transposase/recombinase [Rhodocyclaceae bacterium]
MHRKATIRLLRHEDLRNLQRGSGGEGRKKFSLNARNWLGRLWHRMERMNSLKMREALPLWLSHVSVDEIPGDVQLELLNMSARTIERYLAEEKRHWRRRANSGTRASKHVTSVPLRGLDVQPEGPGHIEIDSVAHCGGSLTGVHVWTVTATDMATGWTVTRAISGKEAVTVRRALEAIEHAFPFSWKAIYFDNGTEFLNDEVVRRFARRGDSQGEIQVFRGRPYRKNDQAHVEQKNWTHVRRLWGYSRFSGEFMASRMNAATHRFWHDLQNFFIPQQKVILNERHGSRRVRKLDRPKTPFERLLCYPNELVPLSVKARLTSEYRTLNPFTLRLKLIRAVRDVFAYVGKEKENPRRHVS